MKRAQITSKKSKREWSKGEIKTIRKRLEVEYGSGPREQSKLLAQLGNIQRATPEERGRLRRRWGMV